MLKKKVKVARSCLTLCTPWNFPGQNAGVRSLFLLQGIFPTQGLNSGLLHCRQIFLPTEVSGKPLIMLSLILYSELVFYIMALVEYLAVNTDDELIYFRSPFHLHFPNHKVSSKSFTGNWFFPGSSASKSPKGLNHHKVMHLIM